MADDRRQPVLSDDDGPTPSRGAASFDIGRALEIVGIIGILVSLVFLGYELKRSNDIAETEAVATIYGMTNEMGLAMAENPALSRVFGQALADFDSLTPDDRWTFFVLLESVININEAAWKYYDNGVISRLEAEHYARGLCKLIGRHPDLVDAWRANREDRLPGFYDYVTDLCELQARL